MPRKSRIEAPPTADFEQSLQRLEELVERLESGDLPLTESLALFEQGVALTRQCHERLTQAQQQVQILLKEGGNTRLADFTPENTLPGADS
jgi:exodeoxyribonuclease VII small subunit